jgi:hypothetical protein
LAAELGESSVTSRFEHLSLQASRCRCPFVMSYMNPL